jgi:PKD repeat protein
VNGRRCASTFVPVAVGAPAADVSLGGFVLHQLLARNEDRRNQTLGQSLVEFALVIPVLLLLLLIAIDFGRIYLGWVNLQQMARLASNYAADHASAWGTPGDATVRARYQSLVLNDARKIDCTLPPALPDPVFAGGTAIGQQVKVTFNCQFGLITPVIGQIIGNSILATADSTYPIKQGIVATVPGGGAPVVVPPSADFVATPRSGWSPLVVSFSDLSLGQPSSWVWDFSIGATATGTAVPTVSPTTALTKGPHDVTYTCAGVPGDVCTFGVSLQVGNAGGSDLETRTTYISVTVPPDTGPIAEFVGTPRAGTAPLPVNFDFVDVRAGAVTYTAWEWDFTNDGTFDATGPSAAHTYSSLGVYDVRLRVTDNLGAQSEVVKTGYIVVSRRLCTVPDFARTKREDAQTLWNAAGFTTTVETMPPNNQGNTNYQIRTQTILGGTIDPRPDGCSSTITVGP